MLGYKLFFFLLCISEVNRTFEVESGNMALRSRSDSVCSRTKRWQKYALTAVIFIYVVVPVMAFFFPKIVSFFVFGQALSSYLYLGDLKNPSGDGLGAARHIDLHTNTGDTLGVWHILPEAALEEKETLPAEEFDARLASGTPIFIYAHGSGGTRGNRMYTYTALRGQGWHVVTFDYRGFADSSGQVSEANMVEDTLTVYHWVKKRAVSSPVFLWGHSLGSGVVIEAARVLSARNDAPDGIVVEGAFNNLHDMVDINMLTLPYRIFPFLIRIFQEALKYDSVLFASDEHLPHVKCPTLMLHAEDDRVVPLSFARKLFHSVKSARQEDQPLVTMHVFPANKGYGHIGISQAPDLGSLLRQFVHNSQKGQKSG